MGTNAGLKFKSGRGRGGIVENIYIRNISMFDIVNESFVFDLYYGSKIEWTNSSDTLVQNKEETLPPVTEKTPVFRNIYVENLISRNANKAMFFNGLPEMNIHNIHIKNSNISAHFGAELIESDGITFNNVEITPKEGAALTLNNVKNFRMYDSVFPVGLKNPVEIKGKNSKNIHISDNK